MLTIEKKTEDDKVTITLDGRLDVSTAPQLAETLQKSLDRTTELVFDLEKLEYISSAGLRILMTAQKAMMACGGKMTVAHPNPTVQSVFDITGMSSIFTIV